MVPRDPDQFYTGIVAELYRTLRAASPDPEPYVRFIEGSGQPALELGCGDGDPILDLVGRGLDVEGLDSSDDMLDRCRARAAALDLPITLHRQSMQEMDLPRRYRSIYLAGATFNLLPDDDTARRVLVRIRDHLTADGRALIPLMVPSPTTRSETAREQVDANGSVVRLVGQPPIRDEATRTQRTVLRYERISTDGTTERSEREWLLHWYPKPIFDALVDGCGLATVAVVDVADAPGGDETFAFIVGRAAR